MSSRTLAESLEKLVERASRLFERESASGKQAGRLFNSCHPRTFRCVLAPLLAGLLTASVRAETETIDLKTLAKKTESDEMPLPKARPQGERSEATRPAMMLLVVSDANGKEICLVTNAVVEETGAS